MNNLLDSKITWIGCIPSSWKIERLQWHLIEVNEKNNPIQTVNVLSLTNKLGVVPYCEKGNQGNIAKEKYDEYKIAYQETIVVNSMNVLIGSVGISNYFGCVSPVYYVFKARISSDLDFFNYIFQTTEFQKELRRYANGILEIRLRLSAAHILRRNVPVPPYLEQQKIVKTLKNKEDKINRLISNEEKQIEKLKEYKQALISEVVTKGLNPNVPMKDSGVEWIGKIPETWEVTKVKYIATKMNKGSGITKDDIVLDGNASCVRYGEIYTKYDIYFEKCSTRTNLDKIDKQVFFGYGDILFSGTGELVEEIGKNIVYLGNDRCLAGGDIILLHHNQHPLFLSYLLNSFSCQQQKSKGKSKLKVVHISSSEIGNIYISLPNLDEQQQIAEYLKAKTESIDRIITIKQEKILRLQEYKKSLIYEYVTGKRRVD